MGGRNALAAITEGSAGMINPNLYLMIMDRLNIKVIQAVHHNEQSRAWYYNKDKNLL